MKYNPVIHHRRSIRLKGYDYSQPCAYFITICTHNRECLFGEIVDRSMVLNKFGLFVQNEWKNTSLVRRNVIVDEYIVMPNHVHGILIITDDDTDHRRGVLQYAPTVSHEFPLSDTNTFHSPSKTIGAIIRGFKSATTKQINQMRQSPGIPVWQRNYHERIIRNENELNKIRHYIINNLLNWTNDDYYQ